MSTKPEIKAFVLRAMRTRDGHPATEQLLLSVIANTFTGDITRTEAKALLDDMVAEQMLAADTHPVLKTRSYTLTTEGRLAAQQL